MHKPDTSSPRALSVGSICVTAAFVALLPQFYLVFSLSNRYTMGWSALDRWGIWGAIGLLALVYGLIYASALGGITLAFRSPLRETARCLLHGVVSWVLFVLLLRTVMAIAFNAPHLPASIKSAIDSSMGKLIFYFLLPVGLLTLCRGWYARFILFLYRILAISCALFFIQSSLWATYSDGTRTGGISPTLSDTTGHMNSLYIFLFDEWSYPDTFGNPVFNLAEMPNLQSFMSQSVIFENAFSPAAVTKGSIPRFLYKNYEAVQRMSFQEIFAKINRNTFQEQDQRSIFDLTTNHFRCVVGTYLYYDHIVGGRVDYNVPFYDHRYLSSLRCFPMLYTQISFLRYIGISIRKFNFEPPNIWVQYQANIRPVLNDILPRLPMRTIAFFHMNLPHVPYAFYRDWTMRAQLIPDEEGTPADYLENVYAMDAVIGDIMRALKARGDYDQSLIVLLSDHARKPFREQEEGVLYEHLPQDTTKHVPLLIKYPGQTRAGTSTSLVFTTQLHPLFREYLQDTAQVTQWVTRWNNGHDTNPIYPLLRSGRD